ncbi:MAG: WG repeat-containing protein [Salegentibacter sp.]|uniref:WG containing repeat-containing protein n=1 Tax=Salegentibacter flavus TaxID=287099 RepID=A0A1I5BJ80_9FLAO|nr:MULTISPECIES: WG repeat-containing protein [Salegentibacter]MDR9457436.1 WG repeat-containing protein [Salegentibacter sp.]SFN74710.1 WG containing repeat-containing protein [Salegentibacter flavus]
MKPIRLFLILLVPFFMEAQELKDLSYVGSLHEGYAPVKKNNQWGFIDASGELVVDFRNDLIENEKVSTARDLGVATQKVPVMQENRAIIKKNIDGVNYYGFIDETGKVVIEPEFLNVSLFNDGKALALKLAEEELGKNPVLGKRMISYKYDVVFIDKDGEVLQYLSGPFPVSVSKRNLREAPPITARILTDNLISVRGPDKSWELFTH